MQTQCLPAGEDTIRLGAELLLQGQLVAFPTETVYGLGANALNEDAVLRIFAAKGRPADNPLIVHVADIQDLAPLCQVDDRSRHLMDVFWPGPLTLLLPKTPAVPSVVTAGLSTVAVRMPSHPVARALLATCGCPVAAPSANSSGRPSPTKAAHVMEDLQGRIPLILDGGDCEVGLESTVLDMTRDIPVVLRPGGVTPAMLSPILGDVKVADSVLRPLQAGEKALSPGMRYRHYAPCGMLTLVSGQPERVCSVCANRYDEALANGKSACILAFSEHIPAYGARYVLSIGSLNRPEEAASRLYDLLRRMDHEGIACIFSEILPAQGMGLAVMNRLSRAASFSKIDADQE